MHHAKGRALEELKVPHLAVNYATVFRASYGTAAAVLIRAAQVIYNRGVRITQDDQQGAVIRLVRGIAACSSCSVVGHICKEDL